MNFKLRNLCFLFVIFLFVLAASWGCDDENDSTHKTTGSVSDYEGNAYATVKIGSQWWMADNLKSTKYSDGSDIAEYYIIEGLTSGNEEIYGLLYTWSAVMNGAASDNSSPGIVQGACPGGWHVPSDNDWEDLTLFVGGSHIAGGKLKAIGSLEGGDGYWSLPNIGATDEYGFGALPGGYYYSGMGSYQINNASRFWTSTESDTVPTSAIERIFSYDVESVMKAQDSKVTYFSCRCVKN